MFNRIGVPELLLILLVALLLFGPKKLPELGRSLGQGLREFRRATREIQEAMEDEEPAGNPGGTGSAGGEAKAAGSGKDGGQD
ncbi:MAG: twin-arginine translocase TatA/TatE family subunit [Firmicutes bacterium]|nr:twin-arginine translocase TatA/TatE family subunit [Bacillota bacterium]